MKKMIMGLLYDPEILLLSIYPNYVIVMSKNYTNAHVIVTFVTVKL